jgi:hypothetical protein
MSIVFKVENLGLNELGVKELNEYFKDRNTHYKEGDFHLNQMFGKKTKKFKQAKSFLSRGGDNYVTTIEAWDHDNRFVEFVLLLKHINSKITKIETDEKVNKFSF